MLLRTEKKFEFSDARLSTLSPGTQHHHVVQQVLNVPLWIVDFFPKDHGHTPIGNPQRWSRQLTASVRGLIDALQSSDSMRAQVHALLPRHMLQQGALQLARCSAIWKAHPVDEPEQDTWLIETDHGSLSDPEFEIDAEELRKISLHWKDESFHQMEN